MTRRDLNIQSRVKYGEAVVCVAFDEGLTLTRVYQILKRGRVAVPKTLRCDARMKRTVELHELGLTGRAIAVQLKMDSANVTHLLRRAGVQPGLCTVCGTRCRQLLARTQYCSDACRKKAWRQKNGRRTHAHHWIYETPNGATSVGCCRICGTLREDRNSFSQESFSYNQGLG